MDWRTLSSKPLLGNLIGQGLGVKTILEVIFLFGADLLQIASPDMVVGHHQPVRRDERPRPARVEADRRLLHVVRAILVDQCRNRISSSSRRAAELLNNHMPSSPKRGGRFDHDLAPARAAHAQTAPMRVVMVFSPCSVSGTRHLCPAAGARSYRRNAWSVERGEWRKMAGRLGACGCVCQFLGFAVFRLRPSYLTRIVAKFSRIRVFSS